jgi:hypothetical protein
MKNRLKVDSVNALKLHDQPRVDVLRFLISLIDKKELQLPPGVMTESDEILVLTKELKNKEESREMFLKGGRADLVGQLDYEITVLKEYLPTQMSDEELEKIIDDAIVESDGLIANVMKVVITKVAGRVGGDRIVPIVKNKLASRN